MIKGFLLIGHTSANRWIANFAAENGQKLRQVMKQTKSTAKLGELEIQKANVAVLKKQLNYEKMKAEAYDMMLDVAAGGTSALVRYL